MIKNKLTVSLIAAGLAFASVNAFAADSATPQVDSTPKPAARPTTLPPPSTKQGLTFAHDIKPLFEASCIKCHGAQRPKAALSLDTLEGVTAGSEEGKILIPGNSEKSKLVLSIARLNPKTAMPPEPRQRRGPGGPGGADRPPGTPGQAPGGEKPAEVAHVSMTNAPAGNANRPPGGPGQRNQGPPAKPLTAEEVGLVRAWIDQGAK